MVVRPWQMVGNVNQEDDPIYRRLLTNGRNLPPDGKALGYTKLLPIDLAALAPQKLEYGWTKTMGSTVRVDEDAAVSGREEEELLPDAQMR